MYYQPRKIVGQQVASEADKNTRKPDMKTTLFLGEIVDEGIKIDCVPICN